MQYDAQGFATAEDGTRLFYGALGRGSPIVLNDGIGCDGFIWKYLQPHYAERHRVVHWHYRGHGRSGGPRDRNRLDVPALARDLLSVLDELEVERAHMFAHSLGTQVVLELYRLAPERVRGLVLLCGSYGRITHTFHGSDMLQQVLPTLLDAVQRNLGMARALWGRVPAGLAYRVASMSREVDALAIREEDFRRYWDHVSIMDPDVFLAMLRCAGDHTAEDILPQVQVPTLVIAGDHDTFTPAALAEHMAGSIPGAELLMLRGGSHAAPVEQPVVIRTRIDRFLAALDEERRTAGEPRGR